MIDPKEMYFEPGDIEKIMRKPDTRMVRCVIQGYLDCAANCPEACICSQLPRSVYEEAYKKKYANRRTMRTEAKRKGAMK